jgi:two-component system, NtrC family, response regulator AtoC
LQRTRILIVDDEPSALEVLEMHLTEKDFEVRCTLEAGGVIDKIARFRPQIVILDVRLADADGLDVLNEIRALSEKPQVIVVTAFHDMATTIKAIKRGAFEYIPKPIDLDDLDAAIERACELSGAHFSADGLSIGDIHDFEPGEIVGKTKEMKEIFKTIGMLSNNSVTVLIEGETGTGKELVARAIHCNSPYKEEPFVAINCSAIVEGLLESELFGHEKGAFTGAAGSKKGKFEIAAHGTILLDEICEMPLSLQAKLLRFLQDKEFQRVGGEKTIRSEARIIASTNRDIFEMVRSGDFRRDLYYRLNVATIRIPPLRHRLADIPLIVEYLLKKINVNLNKQIEHVERKALQRLRDYPWPGNVRELENLLTRAVMHTQGNTIPDDTLVRLFRNRRLAENAGAVTDLEVELLPDAHPTDRDLILNALHKTQWHYGNAGKLLGISYPTLRKRMRAYGIVTKPHKQSCS